MKKLLSILLTFVMVFSFVGMSTSAAQNSGTAEKGTIVINNTGDDTTYRIYKLLNLAGYDNELKAYRYTLLEETSDQYDWYKFFKTGDGKDYVDIDDAGNVTAKNTFTESTANEFAQKALTYAKTNNLAATAIQKGEDAINGVLNFTNLDLGYYLVDSSVGALCGLTTTKPTGSINVKNSIPTVQKFVQEDSNVGTGTNEWGKTNSVDIGQTIYYDVTINAQAGAENYIYHDKMDAGFTLVDEEVDQDREGYIFDGVKDGIIVKHHNPNTTVTTVLTATGATPDYSVEKPCEDGCAFEIKFTKSFCDSIKANDKIYISYTAKLLSGANIEAGNNNTGWVTFGDYDADGKQTHKTNEDKTTTYTFGVDIVKTDSNGNMLEGAEFKVYTVPTGGEAIKFATVEGSGIYRKYVVTASGEVATDIVKVLKINNNTIARIKGLDNGTYYLEEIKTPNGYNPLTSRKEFTVSGNNILANFEDETNKTGYIIGSGVHIENKTGTTMPETGGMGTTLFVSLGAIVVLGTGVLLVTKKRMSMIDD